MALNVDPVNFESLVVGCANMYGDAQPLTEKWTSIVYIMCMNEMVVKIVSSTSVCILHYPGL